MSSSSSAMYGLNLPTGSLSPFVGQSEKHQFLVGTISARHDNEIHLIEYDEDENELKMEAIYSHPHEVWSIACNPHSVDLFCTSYHDGSNYVSSLWKIKNLNGSLARKSSSQEDAAPSSPNLNNNNNNPSNTSNNLSTTHEPLRRPTSSSTNSSHNDLTKIADIHSSQNAIRSVLWDVHETSRSLLTLDDQSIILWELDESEPNPVSEIRKGNELKGLRAGCWDPHHFSQFVTTDHTNIRGWDARSMSCSYLIKVGHEDTIRDVDYNPNKPYHIVTGGDDRRVCLFDLRKPDQPLKTLMNHTHWVSSVKYNRFHDQLIVTAGTELVSLWSITSVSSAPINEPLNEIPSKANEENNKSSNKDKNLTPADRLIKTYSDHEDSIYGLSWSPADAWIFATISYDGRVVINHVPAAEKYKILL